MALWDCQCYQFSVPSLVCTVPASVVACPVSDLVVVVFITCTNAANNQDGISDSGCCGLTMMQAGEGALGGRLNMLLATEQRTDSWEDTP